MILIFPPHSSQALISLSAAPLTDVPVLAALPEHGLDAEVLLANEGALAVVVAVVVAAAVVVGAVVGEVAVVLSRSQAAESP